MGNEICVCVYVLSGLYLYCSQLKEFKVIGRRFPTEKNKNPTLYRMRIFAPDEVAAKSRFWYFMKKLRKIKKTNGQLVYIAEVINPIPHSHSYIILIPILPYSFFLFLSHSHFIFPTSCIHLSTSTIPGHSQSSFLFLFHILIPIPSSHSSILILLFSFIVIIYMYF